MRTDSMRSDIDIKRDVEAEVRWNPDIDATDIAVAVKDGVVALANDIEVRLPIFNRRPDPEIARDAVAAIQNELPYSSDHIRVVVKDGRITLEGSVDWNYQRERAEHAVRRLRGVKGITPLTHIQQRAPPAEIKEKIEEAFRRSAELDAARVTAETDGGAGTLQGTVRARGEREEAERAAWAAPGVTRVDTRIVISP